MFRCILSFIKWFTPTCSTTMSVEEFAKWISIQWRISFDVASRKLTIFEFPLEMKLLNSLRQIPFGMMSVTNKIYFLSFRVWTTLLKGFVPGIIAIRDEKPVSFLGCLFITRKGRLFSISEDCMLLTGLFVAALSISSCFPLKPIWFNFESSLNIFTGP